MNSTMDTGELFFSGDISDAVYGLGFYFITLLLIFILCYTSHICKRRMHSPPPPPPPTTAADHHYLSITHGLRDDILATFPTFLYSEIVMPAESDTNTEVRHMNSYNSGCSICLAGYKPTDVVRFLPECGHLFHVSCIDTWLKVHATCPVCRNSFDSTD